MKQDLGGRLSQHQQLAKCRWLGAGIHESNTAVRRPSVPSLSAVRPQPPERVGVHQRNHRAGMLIASAGAASKASTSTEAACVTSSTASNASPPSFAATMASAITCVEPPAPSCVNLPSTAPWAWRRCPEDREDPDSSRKNNSWTSGNEGFALPLDCRHAPMSDATAISASNDGGGQ